MTRISIEVTFKLIKVDAGTYQLSASPTPSL